MAKKKSELGIHTFSVSMRLTGKQYDSVTRALMDDHQEYIPEKIGDYYKGYYYPLKKVKGVKLKLMKIYNEEKRKFFHRISVQIEPGQCLNEDNPLALYNPTCRNYDKLNKSLKRVYKKYQILGGLSTQEINRIDVTANLYLESQDEVDEYIRLLKKSKVPRDYHIKVFDKKERKAPDPVTATKHSHCITCKCATFLAYDKVDQLKMVGRGVEVNEGEYVLRLEIQMKRKAFAKHFREDDETNLDYLASLCSQADIIIQDYLGLMLLDIGNHYTYKVAKQIVEKKEKKERIRKRMLLLLRKISDCKSINAALKSEELSKLSSKEINTVLNHFRKLDLSPVSLPNDSNCTALEPLNSYF